jgi:hypothetical protein
MATAAAAAAATAATAAAAAAAAAASAVASPRELDPVLFLQSASSIDEAEQRGGSAMDWLPHVTQTQL